MHYLRQECYQLSKFASKNAYICLFQIRSFATTSDTATPKIRIISSQNVIDKSLLSKNEKEFQRILKDNRNKKSFLTAVEVFNQTRGGRIRGHVEFINAALKNLKDYNLHKDLDAYKALLNVFPKGIMIPKNIFQKIFLHHPVQQVCCVDILDQMEWFGVQPDKEVHDIVTNAFGEYNFASKKAKRMLYWMPKIKHTNPYLDRRHVENQDLSDVDLARIALKMICKDAGTIFSYFKTNKTNEDPFGKWIVTGQSPFQRRLISEMSTTTCYFVDGPFPLYVHDKRVEYCVFSGLPQIEEDETFVDQRSFFNYENLHENLFDNKSEKRANIHLQSDQTILGMCIMEEATQYCASAWISHLQARNNYLCTASILMRIKEPEKKPMGLEI